MRFQWVSWRDVENFPMCPPWLCFWELHSPSATRTTSGMGCDAKTVNKMQWDLSWGSWETHRCCPLGVVKREGRPVVGLLYLSGAKFGAVPWKEHWGIEKLVPDDITGALNQAMWRWSSLLHQSINDLFLKWFECDVWSLATRALSDQLSTVVKKWCVSFSFYFSEIEKKGEGLTYSRNAHQQIKLLFKMIK